MTNETYEKNLAVIQKLRPSLYETLEPSIKKLEASTDGDFGNEIFKIIDGELATKNLIYINKEKGISRLIHQPNGPAEALQSIRDAKIKNPQLVFFFGLGLGYNLVEFMKVKTKKTFGLCIVEPNPMMFLHTLMTHDLVEALAFPLNFFVVGETVACAKLQLVRFFEAHNTVNRSLNAIGNPAQLEMESEYFNEVISYLFYARDQATIWSGNSVEDSLHGLQNVLNNLPRLIENPGFTRLHGKFKGQTVISVAAGPGVNEAWDFLKRIQGRIPIIACDTLVKPMNQHGVAPDFITALERDPIVADMFRGQTIPERSSLIGPSLLLPDAFECFKGRHIIYGAAAAYASTLPVDHLGPFSPGSSAGNVNIAAAIQMGFKRVIMIGHNLAYGLNSHESHVKGTIDKTRETPRTEEEMKKIATGGKVKTADDKDEVYTIFEYNLFRTQIENSIAVATETEFINCTAKGAKILGAKFVPLDEVAQMLEQETPFDIYPHILEYCQPRSPEEISACQEQAFNRLDSICKAFEKAQSELRPLGQKMNKWKEEITLAEAKGKRWTSEKLNSCLDEVLSFKVEYVNKSDDFSPAFVSVISPAHNVFERSLNEMIGSYEDNYLLKKDFLLAHMNFFNLWQHWLPKIGQEYQKARDRMQKLLPVTAVTASVSNEAHVSV